MSAHDLASQELGDAVTALIHFFTTIFEEIEARDAAIATAIERIEARLIAKTHVELPDKKNWYTPTEAAQLLGKAITRFESGAGEWLQKIAQPVRPYLGLRTVPLPCMAKLPDQIVRWGAEVIEEYASEFARANAVEVHAILSQRIRLEFNRFGESVAIREVGREDVFRN